MTASLGMRLAVTGTSGRWQAALRSGHRRTLAECGHGHRNRDGGQANARQCGELLIRAARNPHAAAAFRAHAVESAAAAQRAGARITLEEASARATATLDTWRTVVLDGDLHVPSRAWGADRPACGCCIPEPSPGEQERAARRAAHRAPWSAP